jgi:uncharacterized membrane protein (GlpM family)
MKKKIMVYFNFMSIVQKNLKAMKNQIIFSFENEVYNYLIFIGSVYSFGDEDGINNLSHNSIKWEAK